MRQLAVFSGKGGTGKTTLVATFTHLAGQAVAVDCDVDAANLAILLPGEDEPPRDFFAGEKAVIAADKCIGCGRCARVCRFDAIERAARTYKVLPLFCEGCHACDPACPTDAITYTPNKAGVWTRRRREGGWLIHAELGVAQDNSGKLVAHVREQARLTAREAGIDLILVDGPPGIGCPAHAAMGDLSAALIVTEPSVSGEHDLIRFLDTAARFEVHPAVVVNKWDLSPELTERIEAMCAERGVPVLGRVPFDAAVPRLLTQGRLPLEAPASPETISALRAIWERFSALD
ncbi:MAG: ATP-binding protein [Deltaproteobacteria bacterium]|nr:ATP-binding protein [Deltaproteobacteria bacterium]